MRTTSPATVQQRNSASAMHVFIGWLTDHAMHWTLQILYTYRLVKVVLTLSAKKGSDVRGW